MKKIMQRGAIVIAVLAVVIGIGVYFLTHDPDKKSNSELSAIPTVVDSAGTTYGAVVNEQGTTYVVVTDKETNRYMAEFDGVTVGSTVTQINNEVKAEDLPSNYTGPDVAVSHNISDYMGEVVTNKADKNAPSTTASADKNGNKDKPTQSSAAPAESKPGQTEVAATTAAQSQNGTTNPGEKPAATTQASNQGTTNPGSNQNVTTPSSNAAPVQTTAPTNSSTTSSSSAPLQAYRIKKYEEIFKSGTYVMTVTMNDPEYPEPVTMALKNGNIFIETAMVMEEGAEPFKMKMLYLKNTDTMYLLIDDLKKYCKLPAEMVAEFDMGSMVSDFKITTVGEIKVSQANINGKNLIVESYINEAGETVNYYFDGESIVRLDTVSKKGTTDSVYYSLFSTDVSDSYFQIPKDYGYWNLSWMGALM